VEVRGESVRELATGAAHAVIPGLDLRSGPWDLHALVPGQLKGNPRPPLRRRADLVAEGILGLLDSWRRRTMRQRAAGQVGLVGLAQVLLVEANRLFAAASPVLSLPPAASWPSCLPAGLAPVADDPGSPNSAFRKLAEALACMGQAPQPFDLAVDLGASPGGWTRVLRRAGARVIAVDRSPLAPALLADAAVDFVAGDAFAFRPAQRVPWLVADVVSTPARTLELVETWCGAGLAERLVVQMKFRGDADLEAVAAALALARRHGYAARAKHFFNDKNEMTLMMTREPRQGAASEAQDGATTGA
jgi:hypothetical protein